MRRLLLGAALPSLMLFCVPATLAQNKSPAGKTSALPKAGDQVLLQADQIVYDGDAETVAAIGHVEIVDQGRILNADNVTYDQKTDTVTANGHVALTDSSGNVAFADHVVLTQGMRDGALSGFGALIGENGRLAAADARRINGNTVIANHTVYTPCKICLK